jgi:hypothetical protein
MIEDQPELALDLSNIIGGLPSHGYVVISNLPRGSRLSHGYDSGDDTWTLMVDELPGLKFLPGPVRGIVSLRAQIFDPTAGGGGQTKKEFPLVLHMADASPMPEDKIQARNPTTVPIRKDEQRQRGTSAEAQGNPNASNLRLPSTGGKATGRVLPNSDEHLDIPKAPGESLTRPAEVAAPPVLNFAREAEQSTIAEPVAAKRTIWGADAERRFADAVAALRREAEKVVQAAERRHRTEVEELSRAIAKQHELITTLKEEAEQAALLHREAERNWQKAEAGRMKAAQDAWAKEKEELKSEAALKAKDFAARLKKITADAERLAVKTRTDYESAVLRCLSEAEREVRAIFQTKAR